MFSMKMKHENIAYAFVEISKNILVCDIILILWNLNSITAVVVRGKVNYSSKGKFDAYFDQYFLQSFKDSKTIVEKDRN